MLGGRRTGRTRYRPDPWRWPEAAVIASWSGVAAAGWWKNRHQVPSANPCLDAVPQVSLLALLALANGLAGALCSPPQARP